MSAIDVDDLTNKNLLTAPDAETIMDNARSVIGITPGTGLPKTPSWSDSEEDDLPKTDVDAEDFSSSQLPLANTSPPPSLGYASSKSPPFSSSVQTTQPRHNFNEYGEAIPQGGETHVSSGHIGSKKYTAPQIRFDDEQKRIRQPLSAYESPSRGGHRESEALSMEDLMPFVESLDDRLKSAESIIGPLQGYPAFEERISRTFDTLSQEVKNLKQVVTVLQNQVASRVATSFPRDTSSSTASRSQPTATRVAQLDDECSLLSTMITQLENLQSLSFADKMSFQRRFCNVVRDHAGEAQAADIRELVGPLDVMTRRTANDHKKVVSKLRNWLAHLHD